MDRFLGLDLGNANSVFSFWDGQQLNVLSLEGQGSTPSVLMHEPSGQVLIGYNAQTKLELNPQDCFCSILSLLGARKEDIKALGQHNFYQFVPAPKAHSQNATPEQKKLFEEHKSTQEMWINDGYQVLSPVQLLAEYLLRLYDLLKNRLDAEYPATFAPNLDSAQAQSSSDSQTLQLNKIPLFITCPSYFNAQQRQMLKEAASLAGLSCHVVAESTANLMCFADTVFTQLSRQATNMQDSLVLLYSWGASKFECSLAVLNYDHYAKGRSKDLSADKLRVGALSQDCTISDIQGQGLLEVLVQASTSSLSGDEITWGVVDSLIKDFEFRNQIDLSSSQEVRQRLFIAAEKAKLDLSKATHADILVPYVWKDGTRDLHINVELTREQLYKFYRSFVRKTYEFCTSCLQQVKASWDQVLHVVLVGGATHCSVVQEELKHLLQNRKSEQTTAQDRNRQLLRSFGLADFMGQDLNQDQQPAYVPNFIDLDSLSAPAAKGAVLYGAWQQGLYGDKLQYVDCLPYAFGIGANDRSGLDILPEYSPLPAKESQVFIVMEQSKEQLLGSRAPQGFYFTQEKECDADGSLQATVTFLIRQGQFLLSKVSLPHVKLIDASVPRRGLGEIGGFFGERPSIEKVARVQVQMAVNLNHELTVTITDQSNPSNSQEWCLPQPWAGSVEFQRMRQSLLLNFLFEKKQKQVDTLAKLNPAQLLSYIDTHPEDRALLGKFTGLSLPSLVIPPSSNSEPRDSDMATSASISSSTSTSNTDFAVAAMANDSDNVKNEGANGDEVATTSDIQATIAKAQALLVKQRQENTQSFDLSIVSSVIDQAFADKLSTILDKATSQLSTYHQCTKELQELKDLLGATLYELNRVKQQSSQEMTKLKKFAIEGLLKDLLPVFDALDQAVNFGQEHSIDAAILQGQQQILDLMQGVLQQHKVVVEDPTGKPFDPQFHQALSLFVTTEVPPKHVYKTLQKGWILNGRVIRPAQVLVSKAPE